jgi:hypothetical protein
MSAESRRKEARRKKAESKKVWYKSGKFLWPAGIVVIFVIATLVNL